jgi:uncharacterized protein with PIN domain
MKCMRCEEDENGPIEVEFGQDHMPTFALQRYFCLMRVTTVGEAFEMMKSQMAIFITDKYKLPKRQANEQKTKLKYLESYLGKKQSTISENPNDNLMDVWRCMGVISHFHSFMFHLDNGNYPGLFSCLGDIQQCRIFGKFGRFMSKFADDIQQEKVENYGVLETQLDWLLEEQHEKYARTVGLFQKRIDCGETNYFDGWCHPQDWAVTIQNNEAKKPRAKQMVEILCPVCNTSLKQVDERSFPFPRDDLGAIDYGKKLECRKT